tara:strand:- start:2433 stop:2591 length:159 start_codon:yes stop_codon:yes gene_type:complete
VWLGESYLPYTKIIRDHVPPNYGPPLFVACTNADQLNLAIPAAKLYIDWAEK